MIWADTSSIPIIQDILALVEEFGLRLFNRPEDAARFSTPDVAYFFDGRIRSEAEVANKLRPLARQIFKDEIALDEHFDNVAPVLDQLSVADYLNQHADKIREPFIRELVENTIRTEYGVEPEQASALQLLSNLPTVEGNEVEVLGNSDEIFTVEGGSARITDSLAQALSGQIRTRMRLTRLQSWGDSFRLSYASNHTVEADYVILAMPFTVLRQVELGVNLPEKLRRFIHEVNLGLNEKLFAGFNQKIWREQETGFVTEIWTDLGFSEAWDDTQRQVSRNNRALTFFLGGDQVRQTQSGSATQQGMRLVNQLENAIPGSRTAANGKFLRTKWAKDPLTRGGYTFFKPGQLTEFGEFLYIESDVPEERQDVNVGNLVFAGEHLSDTFYGFMNGAAETGRLAAEVVIRQIRGIA
jgi:monoamine oxidase